MASRIADHVQLTRNQEGGTAKRLKRLAGGKPIEPQREWRHPRFAFLNTTSRPLDRADSPPDQAAGNIGVSR